jgi:hypothetical protein
VARRERRSTWSHLTQQHDPGLPLGFTALCVEPFVDGPAGHSSRDRLESTDDVAQVALRQLAGATSRAHRPISRLPNAIPRSPTRSRAQRGAATKALVGGSPLWARPGRRLHPCGVCASYQQWRVDRGERGPEDLGRRTMRDQCRQDPVTRLWTRARSRAWSVFAPCCSARRATPTTRPSSVVTSPSSARRGSRERQQSPLSLGATMLIVQRELGAETFAAFSAALSSSRPSGSTVARPDKLSQFIGPPSCRMGSGTLSPT